MRDLRDSPIVARLRLPLFVLPNQLGVFQSQITVAGIQLLIPVHRLIQFSRIATPQQEPCTETQQETRCGQHGEQEDDVCKYYLHSK